MDNRVYLDEQKTSNYCVMKTEIFLSRQLVGENMIEFDFCFQSILTMTDFYEILEVEKTATEDEIKKAYVIHVEIVII